MSGCFAIASSLTDYYREHDPLSARGPERLTVEHCTGIFGQDPGNDPVRKLMQLFATALNDLGRCLLTRFDGSFVRLVEAAGSSTGRLVRLLAEIPYFCDVEPCGGTEVPFYKRAQIAAAVYVVGLLVEELHRSRLGAGDRLIAGNKRRWYNACDHIAQC